MTGNILLCGVGGQGTVLASKLIAEAAMEKGYQVRTAETIGMAQRGGSVVSHVRIGSEIHSPQIPAGCADAMIGFEPAEAVRCLPYLKNGGLMVVNRRFVQPVTAALKGGMEDTEKYVRYIEQNIKNAVVVDADAVCRKLGSFKVLNTVLLGAAAKTGRLPIGIQDLAKTIRSKLPEKFHTINIEALHAL